MPVDIGGLDPITVSLRDYIDGANAAHENAHAREREAVQQHLDSHDKYASTVIEDHFRSHEAEHAAVRLAFENAKEVLAAHQQVQKADQERDRAAVQVALQAVKELAALHAVSHEREHHSHEVVHQREREAASLARADLDNRLRELDAQRAQLREQNNTFMARTEIVALIDRVALSVEAQGKSAENAHTRMDASAAERVGGLQKQIDDLKLAQAAGVGGKQTANYLVGLSIAFITIIVAIVGVYLSTKGGG